MAAAADSQDEPVHPLLAKRPEGKTLFLVFSADRGLCGGYNANVLRPTERLVRPGPNAGAAYRLGGTKRATPASLSALPNPPGQATLR